MSLVSSTIKAMTNLKVFRFLSDYCAALSRLVIIRPTCLNPLRLQHMPTCATLKSLGLAYTWQIPFQQADSNFPPLTGPFAQTLALPYFTLLDDVVERFVKWHLVKRYPLIFGSWRRVTSFYVDLHSRNDLKLQQLEIETGSSLSIYRSIRSIIDRSDNDTFKEKCENKLMAVKEKLLTRTANAVALLYDLVPDHDGHSTACLRTSMGDEEVLCLAMERLFQAGLQPSKFQMSRLRPMSDRVEDEQLSQSLAPCPTDDSEQRNRKYLWESPPSSPPPNPVDLVNTASSFAHFPLGLYDQRSHWEGVEVHSSPTPDEGTCNWDVVLEDDIFSSQVTEASEICVLPLSAGLPNRVIGVINPVSGEGYSQGIGDSGTSSATSGTHCHLMDFGDDLLSFDMMNYCRSNNVDGSSEKLIFTLENDVQNNPLLNHHQGSAEDLFAQDKYYGIEIDLEAFDSLGDDSSDNLDHSCGDDNGLLLHAVPESTTDMPSIGPNEDLHAETIGHVPSFILSIPHLTYHTSDISSSTCSRTDQKESHDSFGDGAAQFNTPSGLSGGTIWDHGTGWEPDSQEFIELDADWEEDEHFLNLIN
ncbi:hypothetical protein JOM56_010468 [Amanita muscaria]